MVEQKKRRREGTDTDQGEVKALRQEVKALRQENERLREESARSREEVEKLKLRNQGKREKHLNRGHLGAKTDRSEGRMVPREE